MSDHIAVVDCGYCDMQKMPTSGGAYCNYHLIKYTIKYEKGPQPRSYWEELFFDQLLAEVERRIFSDL